MTTFLNDLKKIDNETGHFGQFGGRFVPEALISALDQLETEYEKAVADPKFNEDFMDLMKNYVGRPSPLTEANNFSKYAGNAQIFLKREDLNHTGSHKINNVIGQALLTKRMGKKRIIAETGAGQHGVATATAAAETLNFSSKAEINSTSSRTVFSATAFKISSFVKAMRITPNGY